MHLSIPDEIVVAVPLEGILMARRPQSPEAMDKLCNTPRQCSRGVRHTITHSIAWHELYRHLCLPAHLINS